MRQIGQTKKVSCVIVNYNDSNTVQKLVRRIYQYQNLDAIVIVDNGSSDDSFKQLEGLAKKLAPDRIKVLETGQNGGYGAGNNMGVRYSCERLEMDYVLIANPDVEFSDATAGRLSRLLERHPELGAVSAVMEDPAYGRQQNGWPLRGIWGELAKSGPLCRRLFGPFLEYRPSYFQGKKAVYVEAVHGSMLMVDGEKMMDCGGYDEGVFLYYEEGILGCRMKEKGYRTALLLSDHYVHRHSQSISKTYQGMWQRQKLRNESALYYFRNYLGMEKWQELAVRAFFQAVRLEIWCAGLWEKWRRTKGWRPIE